MVAHLNQSDKDFDRQFENLLGAKREVSEEVDAIVRAIIAETRLRGDAALIEYTKKFDQFE